MNDLSVYCITQTGCSKAQEKYKASLSEARNYVWLCLIKIGFRLLESSALADQIRGKPGLGVRVGLGKARRGQEGR